MALTYHLCMGHSLFYLLVFLIPLDGLASANTVFEVETLEAFVVHASDYELRFPNGERSYGTQVRASYTTQGVDSLEDYGIVQFVQGCVFTSRVENGSVKKVRDVARRHFSRVIPFHHPERVIDSFTNDPMDWSSRALPKLPRHSFYKWDQVSGDPRSMKYYYELPPRDPKLYVTTLPGTAFYLEDSQEARNISLQFKTCIYHTQDIPREISPYHIQFATPIQCQSWQSSFIFDHQKGEFTSPKEIDPFCLAPNESQSLSHLTSPTPPKYLEENVERNHIYRKSQ